MICDFSRPGTRAHMMKRPLIPLLFLATLAISACATAANTPASTEPSLPVPDISGLKPEWIQGDCRSMAINATNHQICIAYIASQLPPFDPQKREYFGEQYSPSKFLECAQKQTRGIDGACEKYRLRRVENPEYWPYPDVPKPKWPEAPKESVYKPGMTSKQYFEALCQAEAGEFIYKTVENVEGVYQVRPRANESTAAFEDRYVIEDPYGYTSFESKKADHLFINPPWKTFRFFERYEFTPETSEAKLIQRSGYLQDKQPMKVEEVGVLKSRYGFTWRGIKRPHDREMAIAGGELAVIDLQTGEILGIRRGFTMSGNVVNSPTRINWEFSGACPSYQVQNKDYDFTYWFVAKVLKPIDSNSKEIKEIKK